ncbi:MAG: hypothetical protein WC866_05570 [Patescibacteria group bacterium]|jgi:hypothetical protein
MIGKEESGTDGTAHLAREVLPSCMPLGLRVIGGFILMLAIGVGAMYVAHGRHAPPTPHAAPQR